MIAHTFNTRFLACHEVSKAQATQKIRISYQVNLCIEPTDEIPMKIAKLREPRIIAILEFCCIYSVFKASPQEDEDSYFRAAVG